MPGDHVPVPRGGHGGRVPDQLPGPAPSRTSSGNSITLYLLYSFSTIIVILIKRIIYLLMYLTVVIANFFHEFYFIFYIFLKP